MVAGSEVGRPFGAVPRRTDRAQLRPQSRTRGLRPAVDSSASTFQFRFKNVESETLIRLRRESCQSRCPLIPLGCPPTQMSRGAFATYEYVSVVWSLGPWRGNEVHRSQTDDIISPLCASGHASCSCRSA